MPRNCNFAKSAYIFAGEDTSEGENEDVKVTGLQERNESPERIKSYSDFGAPAQNYLNKEGCNWYKG